MGSIQKAVHLNIIEGKSILPIHRIPSLVDRQGHFYPFISFYLRLCFNLIKFSELYDELDAQIGLMKKKYGKIKELNSHQHTHLFYPVDQIVFELSRHHAIPHVRQYGNIVHSSFFGRCMHMFIFLLAWGEHLLYGKRLSQSPVLKKNILPISFMSWETKRYEGDREVEIVAHPGTMYDRNSKYLPDGREP